MTAHQGDGNAPMLEVFEGPKWLLTLTDVTPSL